MLAKIKQVAGRYVEEKTDKKNRAINITDIDIIASFLSNPDFPWFISFPRSGSHWLRMIMELYFEKPSLTEIYYFKDAIDFTCFHRHDIALKFEGCRNVLYLYREPVDTVYSQLNYEKVDLDDKKIIVYWSELYGKHLSKWLYDEKFTLKKTIISYEELTKDMRNAFNKVCDHFGYDFNGDRLNEVLKRVSKESLKDKTAYDSRIINLSKEYEEKREIFRDSFSSLIYETIYKQNDKLREVFKNI